MMPCAFKFDIDGRSLRGERKGRVYTEVFKTVLRNAETDSALFCFVKL